MNRFLPIDRRVWMDPHPDSNRAKGHFERSKGILDSQTGLITRLNSYIGPECKVIQEGLIALLSRHPERAGDLVWENTDGDYKISPTKRPKPIHFQFTFRQGTWETNGSTYRTLINGDKFLRTFATSSFKDGKLCQSPCSIAALDGLWLILGEYPERSQELTWDSIAEFKGTTVK